QDIAERGGPGEGRDESARRGLVGSRQLIRLFGREPPGDPKDRIQRCVRDDERKYERPRDCGSTASDAFEKQPKRIRQATDEEQLRDVQPDEQTCRVAELGIGRRMQESKE